MPKKTRSYARRPPPPLDHLEQIPIKRVFSELLSVSPPTGYKLIAEKKLRTYLRGGRRYSTRDDVRACVAALRTEQSAA